MIESHTSLKRESTDGADQKLDLPPGFRFHPTDEELVLHYLCRKCSSQRINVPIIAEIDLYKFDPWELPEVALYGEKEWYFFSPRDRKYPNGCRPNRAAGTGYWKATGADKPIGKPKPLGIKKSLVFYAGKAPKGIKTNWIMHEYRLANVDRSASGKNANLRLDDWVLCRIYNKKGTLEKHNNNNVEGVKAVIVNSPEFEEEKPKIISFEQPANEMQQMPMQQQQQMMNDFFHLDNSESVPRLHTDSSGSEHVLSPEFGHEKEVQSAPKGSDLGRFIDDYQVMSYMNGFQDDPFGTQIIYNEQYYSQLHDILINMHKSF